MLSEFHLKILLISLNTMRMGWKNNSSTATKICIIFQSVKKLEIQNLLLGWSRTSLV